MMTIHHDAFDSLIRSPATRHLFIDVEPVAGGLAIVVRAEDKHVVGRTKKPQLAELVFNDCAGDYVSFIVASGGDVTTLTSWADDAVAFFGSSDPAGARLRRHTSNPLLPVLLSRFGVDDFKPSNGALRRCESIHATLDRRGQSQTS